MCKDFTAFGFLQKKRVGQSWTKDQFRSAASPAADQTGRDYVKGGAARPEVSVGENCLETKDPRLCFAQTTLKAAAADRLLRPAYCIGSDVWLRKFLVLCRNKMSVSLPNWISNLASSDWQQDSVPFKGCPFPIGQFTESRKQKQCRPSQASWPAFQA